MSTDSELKLQRRNTTAFIAAHKLTLSLIPTVRTKTQSGGFASSDGTPRPAQTMRLIEQASAYGNNPGLLPAQDGQERRVTYQLLGEWDSDMEVGDHWEVAGVRYEVAELLPYNGYERRGRVIQYG